MPSHSLAPWGSKSREIVPKSARTAPDIIHRAVQLRRRDVSQIVSAFSSQHYEMACAYVWSKAMTALKHLLDTLGSEFIGEMLQRPDIGSATDILSAVTDSEAIALAEDLGIVSNTDAMRLRHAHEAINHFTHYEFENDIEDDDGPSMNEEEAISCLRICVNSILGQPKLGVAHNFAKFRRELEEISFKESDEKIVGLLNSPYFFIKTTLSVLLGLLRSSSGAQLEHAVRNTNVVLPLIWPKLRKPEKWQTGQAYAELYSDGKKEPVNGLKRALTKVSGFDFVPENLRSASFTRAAKEVLEAHEGLNNFYNEPAPMRALAALGTTIPSPAFPVCMTATLSVWLGNPYGHAWNAEESAMKILKALSAERWNYYLDDVLPRDRAILVKLTSDNPVERWLDLINKLDVKIDALTDRLIIQLMRATRERRKEKVQKLAMEIWQKGREQAA